MKYKIKDLIDTYKFVSFLYLECVEHSLCDKDVVSEILHKEDYSVDSEVDIRLTFDGMEVDMEQFLKGMWENYENVVNKEVEKRFNVKFPMLSELSYTVELQEKIDELVDEYAYKIKNHYRNGGSL